MRHEIRFPHDRRAGKDRRIYNDLSYFLNCGVERRSGWERRTQGERRKNWIRVDKWSSAGLPFSEYTTSLRPRFNRSGLRDFTMTVLPVRVPLLTK